MWGAYVKGAFASFERNMDETGFAAAFYGVLENCDFAHVLIAEHERGPKTPVGIVAAAYRDYWLSPHVEWFPWASARNKLESIVYYLHEMRRNHFLILTIKGDDPKRSPDLHFFSHVKDYGVIRQIGVVEDMPPWRERMTLFHTKVIL